MPPACYATNLLSPPSLCPLCVCVCVCVRLLKKCILEWSPPYPPPFHTHTVISFMGFLCLVSSPSGNFSMGNAGHFPQGKTAETESRYPTLINYQVHAGTFRVSVIHQTLTWTTGSLTCIHMIILMHANCYVHTGIGHTNSKSAQHFWLGIKLKHIFLVLLTGLEPQVFRPWVRRCIQIEPLPCW